MLNSAEVVFLINVVFLLPSFLIGETSSELLRVAQGITIIYAIAFLPRIRKYHYVGRLCGLFALFTLLSVLSEFLHSTTDYLYIIRQVFHLLYFPCIFVVLSAVRKKMYFYGMFALLFLYVAELLIFLPKMNIDTSFLNGNLLENRLIKKAKYILLDEGYSLVSVHTIPLLFFSVIPFLSRVKRLLLSILVVFLLVFTFTFTVWAGVIAAFCIFLFASYKYDPLPRYFLSYVLLGGALLLSALCVFYPFETFTLTTGRSLLWEHAFTAFRSHWLFGISMDDFYNNTYQAFMQSGLQAVTDFEEGTFDFTSGGCHNIYLNVAMNKGLLAFLVYLAFLSTLWKAIRASDRGPIWMMGFFYMVVRCFAESTGIIETSSGKLELIFDIYMCSTYSQTIPTRPIGIIAKFDGVPAIWNCIRQHIDLLEETGCKVMLYVPAEQDNACVEMPYRKRMCGYASNRLLHSMLVADEVCALWVPTALSVLRITIVAKRLQLPIIFWVQGTVPDESFMRNRSRLRWLVLYAAEKLAFKLSAGFVFVSDTMAEFYRHRHFKRKPFAVVPCLSEFAGYVASEERIPESFVYIGGMSPWQCFEQTLRLYLEVARPQSIFHVITRNVKEASDTIARIAPGRYDIQVYSITDRTLIPITLSRFQYGLLLREHGNVNHVASPIKFLEYLSCGVDVVMTDAVPYYADIVRKHGVGTVIDTESENIGLRPYSGRAQMVYASLFNKERFVKEYANLISNLDKHK